MELIYIWIAITSLIAFVLFGVDKARAKQRRRRIPERVLLGISALGGSVGALLGMQVFRHKTRHVKFLIGIPICLAINGIFLYAISQLI